ncbi:Predicted arabinose efflux permease, MFS family [Paenibacillus catalpae]|uniref:Predicted arabinose efflux permease, MFS family n=1 Tax=Paenibacillus catalpae TaxID=1045775 RepID=A0A1I2E8E4_9BACL|nr:MFS transporter [Paenibacillus catalpae]SFE88973.1 Predicted arabinose efflux permease, MFS family [Paenibacillus catalpae]
MKWFQSTTAEWKGWSRNIRLFFLSNMLYQFGTGLFSVLYNLYIHELGYPDAMSGTVVSMQSLATAVCFIPIGLFGDRTSRKRLLLIGALCSGIVLAGRSLFESESSLLTMAVLTGIFATVLQVLAIPFLADNVAKADRLRIFSIYSAFVLAAQVAGSLGGGVISDVLQDAGVSELLSFKLVLLAGSIATIGAFLPLQAMRESKRTDKTEENQHAALPQPAPVKKEFRFIAAFAAVELLIGIGSGLVIPYLNLYFTNRFEVSLSGMSFLLSLGQVMTIFSMLIGPSLASRIGQVKAIVIFQTLSLPFLLITGFTNMLLVASISFLFRQALMNAANPLLSATLMNRVSARNQSLANSVMQTAFMLGWATMGPVQSHIITSHGYYWGYAITFSITGLLYVTASLLFYLLFREKKESQPN